MLNLQDYTAEIFYFPLFIAPLTKNFFITPEFDHMFPPLQNLSDVQQNKDIQTSIRHLTALLHSLFGIMGLKEDIFSLGDFSAIVASMLENFPPAASRRKVCYIMLYKYIHYFIYIIIFFLFILC